MAAVTPAPGKAMVVTINGSPLKSSTFRRQKTAGDIPLPTSGLTADADSNYHVPHAAGMIETEITITSIYDTAGPFHNAPFNIRAGVTATVRVGMTAALQTPAITYVCMSTTDNDDAERTGLWEATFKPATDSDTGYYS